MNDTQKQNPALTLWILWGALFFTLFIYLLVLYITTTNAEGFEAPDPEFISTIRMAFGVIAVGEIAAIFVLRHVTFFSKLADGDIASVEELRGKYMTTCILSWALSESIAIYGLVLAFLTHNLVYYFIFLAPAATLYLILRPQLGRYEDTFAEQRSEETAEAAASAPDDTPAPGSW
jgi:hypothetical protein